MVVTDGEAHVGLHNRGGPGDVCHEIEAEKQVEVHEVVLVVPKRVHEIVSLADHACSRQGRAKQQSEALVGVAGHLCWQVALHT